MKKTIIIISTIALLVSACTKDFEEMNKDPFSPTGTTMEALFNGVVGSLQQSMNEQFYLQNEIWYPETELGALTSESWGNSQIGTSELWTNYYLMLSNIRELEKRFDAYCEEQADDAICDKARAQLNILKAYQTFKLSDVFGDMPYSQAGRIWENPSSQATMKPEWDTQESIYKTLLEELVWSRDLLHADSVTTTNGNEYYKLPYDVLLNNDYTLWAEFANSLILRHGLRMYDKDPDYATPLLVEAYNYIYSKMSTSGGGVTGGGICLWPSVLGTSWDNNWSFREHKHLRMGETIWSCLSSTDDMDGSGIFDYRTYLFFDTSHKNDSFPDGAWRTFQLLPDARREICAANSGHLRRCAVYEGRDRGEEYWWHHASVECRRIHPFGCLPVVPLLDPYSTEHQPLDLFLYALHQLYRQSGYLVVLQQHGGQRDELCCVDESRIRR